MDLKLSEEEKLIKDTAAQFVDKELIAREGAFLKQAQPFLPPGAPERRELDAGIAADLANKVTGGKFADNVEDVRSNLDGKIGNE